MRKPVSMIVAGCALVLAACGSSTANPTASPQAPITIGVSLSLSGALSTDVKAVMQRYDMWVQDINKKGGLLGHQVTMKYVDDASSQQQVVTNYTNLITQ